MENAINAPLNPLTNPNPIQILLIEDNDEDALLLQEFLGIARGFFITFSVHLQLLKV